MLYICSRHTIFLLTLKTYKKGQISEHEQELIYFDSQC